MIRVTVAVIGDASARPFPPLLHDSPVFVAGAARFFRYPKAVGLSRVWKKVQSRYRSWMALSINPNSGESVLTEAEVSRSWRQLFKGDVSGDTFTKAEALLDELRAESPLRHRLYTELEELRDKSLQAH